MTTTGNHARMLGSNDRHARLLHERPARRSARYDERTTWMADLADEAAPVALDTDWDAIGRENLLPEPVGPACSCRRCLLHDDPGGCLVIEAEIEAEIRRGDVAEDEAEDAIEAARDLADTALMNEALAQLADEDEAETLDLMGFGTEFDPEDLQWGFTVSERPAGSNGRPSVAYAR